MMLNRLSKQKCTIPDAAECIRNTEENVDLVRRIPTSIASSLGASVPAAGVVKMALEREGPVHCITVPDEIAMEALLYFVGEAEFIYVTTPLLIVWLRSP
jgi:L-serine/L-threonine ammonia-lyase